MPPFAPRAIVIHAGFHKTGTSTIQTTLRKNRALLKPHIAMRLKPRMKELLHATRGYSTWRDPLSLLKAERRFANLLKGLPGMPRRVLCLSAEELSGHMPGRGELRNYSAAPILMERFVQICTRQFPGTPVSICFGVRQAEAWLASAWAEHVTNSSLSLDRDAFCAEYASAGDFAGIVDAVAEQSGADVHRFHLEEHSANPAAPLLALCGVPAEVQGALSLPDRVNTRLPDAVLLDLLGANRAYDDRAARKAAKHKILKAAGYE